MFMSDETSELQAKARHTASGVPRREALEIAGGLFVTGLTSVPTGSQTRRARKVIVGGAGIAGLSCAYELMKRGDDVTGLDAAGRTGGDVRCVREGRADGLCVGA